MDSPIRKRSVVTVLKTTLGRLPKINCHTRVSESKGIQTTNKCVNKGHAHVNNGLTCVA